MNHFIQFEKAIKGMNIPDNRKAANSPNALWFLREGVTTNREHPNVLNAIYHARQVA